MANILIDAGHPSDLHIFRFAVARWREMGHGVHYTALDREMIVEVLERYGLPFDIVYKRHPQRISLLREVPIRTWNTFKVARQQKIDLFVGVPNPTIGLPAFLLRKPYLAVADTEPAHNQLRAAWPFISVLLTPQVYYRDMGPKHVRYTGYKELAYLHPDVYTPDTTVLDELGLSPDAPYFVVRFVAWRATHDVGEHGLSMAAKRAIIRELAQHGQIILSSEDPIPDEFSHLITRYPQERMHDLLAFASLYIGEGNTMASEAAVLGTPSIRANTMDLGYCRDLQKRNLMFQLLDEQAIIAKIQELLAMPDRETVFAARHARLLEEHDSVTDVLAEEGLKLLRS